MNRALQPVKKRQIEEVPDGFRDHTLVRYYFHTWKGMNFLYKLNAQAYDYRTKLGLTIVVWEGRGVAMTAKPVRAHPKTIPQNGRFVQGEATMKP